MIDVSIELGRGCAATSWVYINLVAHNWMLPYWPRKAAEDVWGEDPESLIGSTLAFPAGKLAPAEGGYLLSGRWPYASGVDSSDWMMLGAIGHGPAKEPAGPRIVLVRCSDIEVIDTWHVSGLVGTGSKDVACADVFVPFHRVLNPISSQQGYTPGTEGMSDAYKLPLMPIVPHLVAAPMIGIALAAYDDHVAYLEGQVSTYNRTRVAEHATVQLKVAEAGQLVDIARLLVRERLDGSPPADRPRRAASADRSRALAAQRRLCRRVLRQGGRPDPQRLRRESQLSRPRLAAPASRRARGGAPDQPVLGYQRRRIRAHRRRLTRRPTPCCNRRSRGPVRVDGAKPETAPEPKKKSIGIASRL